MRSSNIKRKTSRFTYSACALFFAGSVFVGCKDDLLTGTPSWLGSSIYAELEERGNFQTTLKLIDDDAIQQTSVLSLTGSKTLFVADDDAYDRFFSSNSWGVKSFDELSDAQKCLLFYSSMINSAYLIELMSSLSNGTSSPTTGSCMRRATSLSLYDTIPCLQANDMPNNSYWSTYRARYPEGGTGGMLVLKDDNVSPMVHFLPAFMTNNSITSEDLAFLTNGACNSISESYVNGQRVVEQDVTCQNGYIHIVENVMDPLTNMAEAIRKDEDLTIFSSLLDRFCVPVYSSSVTNTYNSYNTSGQVDSVYVWRYINDGQEGLSSNALTSLNNETFEYLLPYDPGWNTYANTALGSDMAPDMAVIIAPTDSAFDAYFASTGKSLMDRYLYVDSIPDQIIISMLENYMKTSLVSTVPSKFSTVTNSAQLEMNLQESDFASCIMANNGVVYKSNKVYAVPEWQSVAFPASLDDDILVMRYIIDELEYEAYLNTMESEYMLILPTDEALANYVDPVDYHKNQPTITEFYYDNSSSNTNDLKVRARRYYATKNADGSLTKGSEIANPWTSIDEDDYVENRLKDVLENSILIKDDEHSSAATGNVWVSKGGCPVILRGSGEEVEIITPYRLELASYDDESSVAVINVRDEEGYYNMGSNPDGNGETFIVDAEPVQGATKSVPTLLEELAATNPDFSEFSEIVNHCSLVSETYDFVSSTSSGVTTRVNKTVSNGTTLSIMDNYNYTVYVPPTDKIQELYEAGVLPDWRDVEALEDQLDDASLSDAEIDALEEEVDSLYTVIDNFVRYHVQNNAVYQYGPIASNTYETSYITGGRFTTLQVVNDGAGNITVTCSGVSGEPSRTVNSQYSNYFTREYHFRRATDSSTQSLDIEDAELIYNYSSSVIHLIDEPLLYSDMWTAYQDYINGSTGD